MLGTPWTAHNSSLPAYPSGVSPGGAQEYAGTPGATPTNMALVGLPPTPGSPHSPGRQAVIISGADISIQPLSPAGAFQQDMQAPAQEGPLAYYPTFSQVDPRHKWQRIRDWASHDSATATGPTSGTAAAAAAAHSHALGAPGVGMDMAGAYPAGSAGQVVYGTGHAGAQLPGAPAASASGADPADVTASIDSTLLELELERARASLKAAAAAGGGGGQMPGSRIAGSATNVAAALAAAAMAPGPAAPGAVFGRSADPAAASAAAAMHPAPASREASFGYAAAVSAAAPFPGPAVGTVMNSGAHGRADAYQAGLTAIGEVSAVFNRSLAAGLGLSMPSSAFFGAPRAAAAGVHVPTVLQSQSQTASMVERTALEARCRATEEALAAAERRHAVDVERLQGRIAALEGGLASERQLCGQLQEQLQAELQRLRAVTESEASARAAEAACRGMLEMANQSLELERKRSADAAQLAADASRDLSTRLARAEEHTASLEKQLQQEKDGSARLARQLADAQRQEQALMDKLGTSEGARQQQEMRLEAAADQVTAMRGELQLLNAKLAARDKQLLKHVQDVEETQLAALRAEVAAGKAALQQAEQQYAELKGALATVYQALGPQALAAAFGYSEQLLAGFNASAASYGAVADRLLSGRVVAAQDGEAVVARVRELLTQTRNLYMSSERREVALTAEMDSALSALRQTNMDAEARLASCNTALRAATSRVEELTSHLAEARTRGSEAAAAQQAAAAALTAERGRCQELQVAVLGLQQELADLRAKLVEAQGAQQQLSSSRQQVVALQQQVAHLQQQAEALEALAQRSKETAESKEERIRELRTALSDAMNGTSAAEGQAGALVREKQQVLDALDAERQRSARLEDNVTELQGQLDGLRAHADAADRAYRQLTQQVADASRDALSQAVSLRAALRGASTSPLGNDAGSSSASAPGPLLLYATAQHLQQAEEEAASQLAALEAAMRLDQEQQHQGVSPPQACSRALLACLRHLATQQALTHQQLIAARQSLQAVRSSLAQYQRHAQESEGGSPTRQAAQTSFPGRSGTPSKKPGNASSSMRSPPARSRHQGVVTAGHGPMGHYESAGGAGGDTGQAEGMDKALGSSMALLGKSGGAAAAVEQLAAEVAAASAQAVDDFDGVLQLLQRLEDGETSKTSRMEALANTMQQLERQLQEAREQAAQVPRLQEKLAASESELQHVRATAQAEFTRVQGEVAKAFKATEHVKDEVAAEADARVRAAEQAAARAISDAEERVQALQQDREAAEERLKAAGLARVAAEQAAEQQASTASSALGVLRRELEGAREALAEAQGQLAALHGERQAGLRHLEGLREQLRRAGEEAARWRQVAAPRTRERLVLEARTRVLRRKRADLRSQLSAATLRAEQATAQAEARGRKLKHGINQLRQLQIDVVQLGAKLQEAETRAARADTLLPRLEDRRIALEQDRKAQADKAARLAGQLSEANKALEAARKAEAAARKELDRVLREQLEPQQRRTATVFEELENAAAALQESQANATRLLQQGEALRQELEEVQHAAEDDRLQAQQQLAAASREITDRDALIVDLRRQVSAAQAAAAAAAALLPAVSSGQLGDAAAVQVHLIGQLGQLQAANVELEAKRAATEAELEVIRVRLHRTEAILNSARPGTANTVASAGASHHPQYGGAHVSMSATPQHLHRLQSPLHTDHDMGASTAPRSLASLSPAPFGASTWREDGAIVVSRDPDTASLLAAKEQRITELRAALSSLLADKGALRRELVAAREEQAAVATAAQAASSAAAAAGEQQERKLQDSQDELSRTAVATRAVLAAAEERLSVALAAQQQMQDALSREQQVAQELTASLQAAESAARERELQLTVEVEQAEQAARQQLDEAEEKWRSQMDEQQKRARGEAEEREAWWREEELRWRDQGAAVEQRLREEVEAAQRSARDQVAALERRMREEGAALERRAREAERQAAEAVGRADERTKQAERLKEQMTQVQALHSSAEAAVQQLSSQLRELQQGGGSGQAAAAAAAAEVQLQLQLDQARREAALLQDTITAHETENRRLQAQHEAAVAQARSLGEQLQTLSGDLASARTRIGVLQQELAAHTTEVDALKQANALLQSELAASDERHADAEAQLVEAEQGLSRQQALVRQVQGEYERLLEQYNALQEQLQHMLQERRAAAAQAAAAAVLAEAGVADGGLFMSPGVPSMFASPARSHDPRHTPASKRAAHASSSAKDQHGAQSPARDLDATPKPAPGARRALHLGSQTGEPADAEFDTAAGALETSVYETAMSDLQSKVEQLQRELTSAQARQQEAEHGRQLLQLDLASVANRLKGAEAQVAELSVRLEAVSSDAAQGAASLRQQLLELELQLDEHRDREQAAQEALLRCNARCEELVGQLAAAERRADELQRRCEDAELEVGVVQAQLAAASAQILAQHAEGQPQAGPQPGTAAASGLELQVREQALLVEALQADAQASLARAESAEKELALLKEAAAQAQGELERSERKCQAAAAEAQASSDAAARMRVEAANLSARLTEVEGELLLVQEARDRAMAQVRSVEARLAEEQAEGVSLRRQLAATAGAREDAAGAAGGWPQRVRDLEFALEAAREQAAEAEDAVADAAAAQLRAGALEQRLRDTQAALAEEEARAAAAEEARARSAADLAAKQEDATTLQLQLRNITDQLGVCERQVGDRDARLEGYSAQLALLRGQTEAYEGQLRDVRKEVRELAQERDNLRRKLTSLEQESGESARNNSPREAASVSGLSVSTSAVSHMPQFVGVLSENRDLLEKLTSTHSKLKLAKSKLVQKEQELRSKEAETGRLRAQVAAAGAALSEPGTAARQAASIDPLVATLRAEIQAYKSALAASQEEAAASAAAAAEAQARCDALTQRLQQDMERRASHGQASSRIVEHGSPGMLERLYQQREQQGHGSTHSPRTSEDDGTLQALSQKVRMQKSEIETLTTELQAANSKRTDLAKQAAALSQRLVESEIRERDLASDLETLRQQLALAQQQLHSRQDIIRQLTAAGGDSSADATLPRPSGPPSPTSTARSLGWLHMADDAPPSTSTSPRSQATRAYHSTLSLTPTRSAGAGAGAVGAAGPAGGSQAQLASAQQHALQSSTLDRVVAMWRDACRAKDAKIQELQADVATFTSQLGKARADASELTARVVGREQELAAAQQREQLARESLGAQLAAAEAKLRSRAQQVSTLEEELQQREADLRAAHAQLQATQRSLVSLQADGQAHRDSASTTAQALAASQQQAAAMQARHRELQAEWEETRAKARRLAEQLGPLQDQLGRAEGHVARLVSAVRAALETASGSSSSSAAHLGQQQGTHAPGLQPSLRMLEELVSMLAEELQRRAQALADATASSAALQAQLAAREEDVRLLDAKLKSASESLSSRMDEVARLQSALRRKEADCEAVEAEIRAQIADYQRLKQRLLQQERDSSQLSSDQEALLRRCDELQAALGAKQEECALLARKSAAVEEQWQAGRAATTALQERVHALEAQADVLQRNAHVAALGRQEAAAALDAARSELRAAAAQAAAYREQLEQRNNEVRELNSMLKAWEAMRLGKDAQISALTERCKRHEEDAAEKARTVEALRRKLQAVSGFSARPSVTANAGVAASPTASTASATPGAGYGAVMQHQLQHATPSPSYGGSAGGASRSGGGGSGARHIHLHVHGAAAAAAPSPAASATGSASWGHQGR